MVFYPTLTTPFNRYNSSKRLPLLELGTGVSSNGIDLSTVVMSFNFSQTSKLDKLVCSGIVNDRPCAFTNRRLWVRDGIYRNRGVRRELLQVYAWKRYSARCPENSTSRSNTTLGSFPRIRQSISREKSFHRIFWIEHWLDSGMVHLSALVDEVLETLHSEMLGLVFTYLSMKHAIVTFQIGMFLLYCFRTCRDTLQASYLFVEPKSTTPCTEILCKRHPMTLFFFVG